MADIRKTLIAAALLAALGTTTACTDSGDAKPKPKATVTATEETVEDPQEDVVEEDDETLIVALDKPAEWRNKVTAALSKFSRGTSGEYAFPESTAYLKFTITMTNGHTKPIDLSMTTISCPAGGEEIFDSENGLNGNPDNYLLPGEKADWVVACAFPKTETDVQIEVTPYDSGLTGYRTAIFKGEVK
ncbi:hypothetical protein [Streptomyces werraensis]|uniref:hypothetical protein n=1 Tax=Streptomyces werraensis TaxID=68284 RepID=UPI00343B10B0